MNKETMAIEYVMGRHTNKRSLLKILGRTIIPSFNKWVNVAKPDPVLIAWKMP